MNNLSVISIVRDEIKFIQGLIESTLPFLGENDEWLIQDGGSTDGTWEYLQTVKDPRVKLSQEKQDYSHYHWNDHSIMQNQLVSMTENDWYLSLDADESFPEEFWKEVSSLINQEKYIVYYFPTYNFYKSPKKYIDDGFFYPDIHIRLARKSKTWWVGTDHFSIWRKELQPNGHYKFNFFKPWEFKDVKVLPYHLFHYGRVEDTWRKRLGKEPDAPPLADYNGKHPRGEYNESNSNKPA